MLLTLSLSVSVSLFVSLSLSQALFPPFFLLLRCLSQSAFLSTLSLSSAFSSQAHGGDGQQDKDENFPACRKWAN